MVVELVGYSTEVVLVEYINELLEVMELHSTNFRSPQDPESMVHPL